MVASESVATICRSLGRAALPPAKAHEIAAFERQWGVQLPADAVVLLESFNGSVDSTPGSLVSFRPLADWGSPVQVVGFKYVHLSQFFVFAGYCDESWWYAADLGRTSSTPVFLIDGANPEKQIASSFAEFFEAVVVDNPSIYGIGRA